MEVKNSQKRIPVADAIDIPLAEMDPKVTEDTFCIVTQSWGQTFVHRYNKAPSLNIFHPYSSIRRCTIAFTTHVNYDIGLLIIVLGNLVELAIPHSMPRFFERVSLLFYVSEALHQSLSRGFVVGTYSYLRNPWMCFDFLITIASLPNTGLIVDNKFFVLQSLRGVRILNLVTIVPGVRTMAQGVIHSISHMFGVILMFFIFLLSVTITAKHLFKGVLSQKCVRSFSNSTSSYVNFTKLESNWLKEEDKFFTCGNLTGARSCPNGYVCLPDIKNNYEYIQFENFGASLMNSLGLITHDDWDLAIDEISKASGPLSTLFLAPVIFFGSYCLLNLMVVVVISIYEAMVAAKSEKNKVLSAYTYYSKFQFNIEQLPLYYLPTNEKTLTRIIKQREDLTDHEEAVKKTWKRMQRAINLQQNVIKIMDTNTEQLETNSTEENKGLWTKFRLKVKNFVESNLFQYTIIITIIINSIFLASEHENMKEETIYYLNIGNLVFLSIFSFEMVVKILAYGIHFFFDWWNIMDFLIVALGIAALFSEEMGDVIAFRVLRLLRLTRIHEKWTTLHKVITVIRTSLANILRLVILMSLLIFMFSIIGHRVLGPLYYYSRDLHRLRWSFASFDGSLFLVFKIFTGEWIEDLWDCMIKSYNSPLCPIVFISFFLIGNFIILNLFAALLLSSFDDFPLELTDQKDSFVKKYCIRLRDCLFSNCYKKKNNDDIDIFVENSGIGSKDILIVNSGIESAEMNGQINANNQPNVFLTYLKKSIQSNKFDYIVLTVILVNCICLALHDTRVEEGSEKDWILFGIDVSCVSFFILEMLLRWFANGILNYFTNGWTLFDFCLNVVSIIEIPFHGNTTLRVLRALRSLSVLSKWYEMKVIIRAFCLSVPAILHVIIVVLFVWLPFAIMGMHFFAGSFYRCADKFNVMVEENGISNKTECINKGYKWRNAFFNFDHIGNSYLSLLQLALFSGFGDSVLMMVDSRGRDLQPKENYDKWKYVYVVTFVLVGGFLCFNLFVGAAVDTFRRMQKQVEGTEKVDTQLTPSQKKYYRALVKFGKRRPIFYIEAPSNKVLNIFYIIAFSWWFRITIFFVILASAIFVAVDSHRNSPLKQKVLEISAYVFTFAYTIESIIKILGLRKFYFKDIWNIFDLTILILYTIGEILHQLQETESNLLSFVYAFRILRIFHLLHLTDTFVDLRLLIYAIETSFTSLLNLSFLLFLIIFIYSILGMSAFGHVKYFVWIDSSVNFETWLNSAMLLLRLATAEGWEKIIKSISVEPPDCNPNQIPSDCGNKYLAPAFLFTFLFCTYILITNIFIAVILENYQTSVSEEHDIFNEYNLISFYKEWRKYDPSATHFIPFEDLPALLDGLIRDLRMPKPNHVTIAFMDLPIAVGNKVHCLDVLKGILKVKLDDVEYSELFHGLCNEMERKYEKLFPELKGSRFIHTTMELRRMDQAARIIQAKLKSLKESKLQKKKSLKYIAKM